jgi:hypothetical protein
MTRLEPVRFTEWNIRENEKQTSAAWNCLIGFVGWLDCVELESENSITQS